MKSLQVSVIISCYNYSHFLPDAVASVLRQSYTNWELLIVDDGSTDATRRVAQQLRASAPTSPIRLFAQPNGGPSAARNTGARYAHGQFLLFLDADDVLTPDALRIMVTALQSNPHIAFVSGSFQVTGNNQVLWPGFPVDVNTLKLDNSVLQSSLLRRELWEALGGFDTLLRLGEDWDFWLRAVVGGWCGMVLPDMLLFYRRHGPSLMSQMKSTLWSVRAYLITKHPALYVPRLLRWAQSQLQRHPLPPTPFQPVHLEQIEEIPIDANIPPYVFNPAMPALTPPPNRRRIVRVIPVRLRFQLKKLMRRFQLGWRALLQR